MITDEIANQAIFNSQEHIFKKYAQDKSVQGCCFVFELNDGTLVWYKLKHIASSNRLYGIGVSVSKPYRIELEIFTSGLKFSEIKRYVCITEKEWEYLYTRITIEEKSICGYVESQPNVVELSNKIRFFYSIQQNVLATVKPYGIEKDRSKGTSKASSFIAYYWGIDEEYIIRPSNTYGNWSYRPPITNIKDGERIIVAPGVMYSSAKWKEVSEATAVIIHNRMAKLRRSAYFKIFNTIYQSED